MKLSPSPEGKWEETKVSLTEVLDTNPLKGMVGCKLLSFPAVAEGVVRAEGVVVGVVDILADVDV